MNLFNDIYTNSTIRIAVNDELTAPVTVQRGVLQGDPLSPLLFNICFNTLMMTISKPELRTLGYIWGSANSTNCRMWLQFADDAAIVSSNIKDTQALINVFHAWCSWSDMIIRLDKCQTFAMAKLKGEYKQFEPALFINQGKIPAIGLGASFKYLGKLYDFELKNSAAKKNITEKLETLLSVVSNLKIKSQLKLALVKQYVHSQIRFELRTYNFGTTWIDEHLDNIIIRHIRKWLETPISTCLKEMMSFPKYKGGLSLLTLVNISETEWLRKRNVLKCSKNPDLRALWLQTSAKHIESDALLLTHNSYGEAASMLKDNQISRSTRHFYSLQSQGLSARTLEETIPKSNIQLWATNLETVSTTIHNFAKKALQQQLPTNSNLVRWKRTSDPSCPLCNKSRSQTNKHVLSNCDSAIALNRYTQRHDEVLMILAEWILSSISSTQSLHVDLDTKKFKPISEIVEIEFRPDIIVTSATSVTSIELTVCHETNMRKSKDYKLTKYGNLHDAIKYRWVRLPLHILSVEVSTLGFVSDLTQVIKLCKLPKIPKETLKHIANTALDNSYRIYVKRNCSDINL